MTPSSDDMAGGVPSATAAPSSGTSTEGTGPIDDDTATVEPGEAEGTGGLAHRLKFRRPKRYVLVGAVLASAACGAGIYWLTSGDDSRKPTVEQGPSDAERFVELLKSLKTSEETIARMDAITISDDMLRKLTDLDKLITIQVTAESLSQETARRLAQMPKLEQLHVRGAKVDDARLADLAKSQSIWLLNLPASVATPEGLDVLGEMPMLRQLRLGIKDGDNRHARAVARMSRLRAVHLIGIGVTDEGLQALAKMPQLESLYLDDTAVTDEGWMWLFQNHPQLHVHINQKHHDRDPQKH